MVLGVSGGSAELGDEADRTPSRASIIFLDADDGRDPQEDVDDPPAQAARRRVRGRGDLVDAGDRPGHGLRATSAPATRSSPRPSTSTPTRSSSSTSTASRSTFGQIVGAYKGDIDEYFPGISELPCFDFPGNPPPCYPRGSARAADIDLDFGASPNLFTGPDGRKLVGAGQKSGVYHVFDAKTMEPVWTQLVGPPSQCRRHRRLDRVRRPIRLRADHRPRATRGRSRAANGALRWIAPILDGVHWGPPVAVANGVVYTVDLTGFLDAYDARTGLRCSSGRSRWAAAALPSLSWGGVSIARNTVYAAVGTTGQTGYVIAFRPGGTNDIVSDVTKTIGGLGGGGGGGGGGAGGLSIIAGPGASSSTYATPVDGHAGRRAAELPEPRHRAARRAWPTRRRRTAARSSSTKLIGLGETVPIEGLDRVVSGQTYGFYCSIHPGMTGQLLVQ